MLLLPVESGRRLAGRSSLRLSASVAVGVGRVGALAHVAFVDAALPPAGLARRCGRIGDERERGGREHERGNEDFRGLGKHGHLLRVAMPRRPGGACRYSAPPATITMMWCIVIFARERVRGSLLSCPTEARSSPQPGTR